MRRCRAEAHSGWQETTKYLDACAEQRQSADECVDEYDSHHFTLICNDPLFPPVWAVIVTLPFRFPVTTALADTVAVLVLELDQMKLWFGTRFPLWSLAVAASCIVDPAFTFFDGAVTVTVDTEPGLLVP